jgi:long-chain fatty acid transport protein
VNRFFRPTVLAVAIALSGSALATNGYWSHGYGPKSKSMAGACVAMAFGAMCAASNPGSLAVVGNRLEFGAGLMSPDRGFTADDNAMMPPYGAVNPGEYRSTNNMFLIPHFAYNIQLDADSTFGIAIGGNGGLNTEYNTAVFGNFSNPMGVASSPTSIDMMQAFAGITYSRKLNEAHSFGISPILTAQSLEVQGLEPFQALSLHPGHVTNRGSDLSWGAGLKLGWLWQVNDRLNIGASYQSRIYMTEFDEYKGLLAEEGDFDIPPNMDLGFAYKIRPDFTFSFNYQRIEFSEVNSVGNRSDMVFMPGSVLLGTDDGLGFGWEDVDVFKFGVEWQYDSELSLRAGYSYSEGPVSAGQALFNILAPAVVKHHYTFGVGKKLDGDSELNIAFSYAPRETLSGTNPNTGPQTGSIDMSQWEIEVGWGMRF